MVSSTISLIFMKNTLYLCVRGTAMRSPLNKLELGYFNWNDREWSDRAKFEILASRGPPSIRQKSLETLRSPLEVKRSEEG